MAETIFLLAFLIFQLAVLAVIALLFLYFASAIFVWPPSIPTDRRVRKSITNIINSKYPPDAKIKIIDLGCGYGHLIKTISKTFKNADVTGVELLKLPYFFSKFLFRNDPQIKIIKGDLYQQDISQYDVIVFFLRKEHKVDEVFLPKVKKGAILISNNFPLKTITPTSISEISDVFVKRKVYFYQV